MDSKPRETGNRMICWGVLIPAALSPVSGLLLNRCRYVVTRSRPYLIRPSPFVPLASVALSSATNCGYDGTLALWSASTKNQTSYIASPGPVSGPSPPTLRVGYTSQSSPLPWRNLSIAPSTRSTASSWEVLSVLIWTSGDSGASYGDEMPVNSAISPRRALA